MSAKRLVYADLLRIAATFSVIIIHVAAINWYDIDINSLQWKLMNCYDSIVRFAVPVFVMISGIFFLDVNKTVTYKDIFYKYSFKIIIKYFIWSLFYAVCTSAYYFIMDKTSLLTLVKSIVISTITGHYHMWFLFMIVGLYIISPLLKKIVVDKKATEYFLILSVIFAVGVPALLKIPFLSNAGLLIDNMYFHFTLGYAGYFVAGSYLNGYDISKKWRCLIYITGIAGTLATVVLTDIASVYRGKAVTDFYNNFTINVMLASIAIFVFFKYEVSRIIFHKRLMKLVMLLSKCSFGIYLIHAFYIELFTAIGIKPIISVPIISLIIYILCFITILPLQKIPKINIYFI